MGLFDSRRDPGRSSFAGCCAWRRMKLVPPCARVHYKRISSSIRPPYMTKTTLEYLRFEIPARLPSETLKKVVQNTLRHADLDVEKICQAVRKGERSRQGESISLKHGALERCRIKVKFSSGSGKLHFFLDGSRPVRGKLDGGMPFEAIRLLSQLGRYLQVHRE